MVTAPPIDRRTVALLALGSAGVAAADMAVALGYWCVLHDATPARILQGIAGGWLGREAALAGGTPAALLGAVSHLGLATAMVLAYWAASQGGFVYAVAPRPSLGRHRGASLRTM